MNPTAFHWDEGTDRAIRWLLARPSVPAVYVYSDPSHPGWGLFVPGTPGDPDIGVCLAVIRRTAEGLEITYAEVAA